MDEILEKHKKCLDPKKPQTTNKIKYIKAYVEKWLIIMTQRGDITNINFIDCMCNAGIYADGDLCTATEILKLFYDYAIKNPSKNYCLYLNDYDKKRIEILKDVVSKLIKSIPVNLHLFIDEDDVNLYIKKLIKNDDKFIYPNATILYVDPYDFGTVHIPTLKEFCEKFYCELLFNLFTSDWVRNRNNELDKRIEQVIDDNSIILNNKQELVNYIIGQLKTGRMKYSFNYEFHTETNVELYQIIFFTPNKKGLEVLKDALWEVFDGKSYYRNPTQKMLNSAQLSLFTEEDDQTFIINHNVGMAKKFLLNRAPLNHVSFEDIETLVLSKTMLCERHLLKYLVKPLIDSGNIIKLNENVTNKNYKKDFYNIKG